MKKLLIGLLILGLSPHVFAQVEKTEMLSEVVIAAANYKYLNQVDYSEAAVPVKLLETKIAGYDLKNADFYDEQYDFYTVSFFIPEGKVLASYDKNGKILYTVERYHDIALPKTILESLAERFPNWEITKDIYLINYHETKGIDKKYKITLQNGDQKIKVKLDADGSFL